MIEHPIKMDDLGVPLFLETTIFTIQPSQETKIHSLTAAIGTERSSKEALMNSNDIFISSPFKDYGLNNV